MSKPTYVLDASALIALMLGEAGSDRVQKLLPEAAVGAVNLSEVVAKLQEKGVPDDVIGSSIAELDLVVIPFDSRQAMAAGYLRTSTREAGLSLGDRACLATAISIAVPAVTTDKAWARLSVEAAVEVVR